MNVKAKTNETRMELAKCDIEYILANNKNVVSFELDEDDKVADLDYLVTFENIDAFNSIRDAVLEIEEHLYVTVKTLFEQIDDQIDEGGAYVTVDFYCDVDAVDV